MFDLFSTETVATLKATLTSIFESLEDLKTALLQNGQAVAVAGDKLLRVSVAIQRSPGAGSSSRGVKSKDPFMKKNFKSRNLEKGFLKHKKPSGNVIDIKALLSTSNGSSNSGKKERADPFGGAKPREDKEVVGPSPLPRGARKEKKERRERSRRVNKVEERKPVDVKSLNVFDALGLDDQEQEQE